MFTFIKNFINSKKRSVIESKYDSMIDSTVKFYCRTLAMSGELLKSPELKEAAVNMITKNSDQLVAIDKALNSIDAAIKTVDQESVRKVIDTYNALCYTKAEEVQTNFSSVKKKAEDFISELNEDITDEEK